MAQTEQHTPGPWRWEVSRHSKRVHLCGGHPKRGFGRYDLTVMGFQRYGMNSAAPVFWSWDYAKSVGEPHRADELAVAVPGREHHASWFADIDHPDARLIAAAPELLEALEHLLKVRERDGVKPQSRDAAEAKARAAIAKATGASS